MPNYKVVDADQLDADLKVVADAIRAKGGTEGEIAFPSGFVGAVEGISGGSDIEILADMPIIVDFSNGDQSLSVPDGYAVKSAIIKKPETLIPENIAKDVNIAGVIGTHEGGGGGGSVEGYVTVTFRYTDHEGEKEFSRLIMVGDDCPDPVTQGRIETPLKESTAQYDFTHNGWTDSDGGTADENALKNITEDKTLYAAYSSAVRSYAIKFYDEDGTTILHTEQVEYGKKPSYTPTHPTDPDHYVFDSWSPSLASVTGNANYTVVWKEKAALNDFSWAELDAMPIDEIKTKFKVGDTKTLIDFDSSKYPLYTATLVGIEHDDLADGTGKAKMTFVLDNMPYASNKRRSPGINANWGTMYGMNPNYHLTKYKEDIMGDSYVGNVNPYVKTVKKKYYYGTIYNDGIKESDDTYFWLSMVELGYTSCTHNLDGEKYEFFTEKTMSDVLECAVSVVTGASYQWTRTRKSGQEWYLVKTGAVPSVSVNFDIARYATCGFCI